MLTECIDCKETLKTGFSTIPLKRGECEVVIGNVPAYICPRCGDSFTLPHISRLMAEIADKAAKPGQQQVTVTFSDFSDALHEPEDEESLNLNGAMIPGYSEPVSRLLFKGEDKNSCKPENWPDYIEQYGFTSAHVPELIRMATDEALHNLYSDSSAVYAPIHAWRALGQLKAIESVEPLLPLFQYEHNDWIFEELPAVFSLVGPDSLPLLKAYLADTSHDEWSRISVLDGLKSIAEKYPESRTQCISMIMTQLEKLEQGVEGLNGFLISVLIDLKVVEAVPLIERAFESRQVDETVCGDLEDVLVGIGAKEATPEYLAEKNRRTEEAQRQFERVFHRMLVDKQRETAMEQVQKTLGKKLKSKKKQEKQARKKNRRK